MRIHQLFDSPAIILANEERDFIDRYPSNILINSLCDRDEVIARNLVRKGIYEISNDSKHLLLKGKRKTL